MKFECAIKDSNSLLGWLISDPIKQFLERGYTLRCSSLDNNGRPYNSSIRITEVQYGKFTITGISRYELELIKRAGEVPITIRLDSIDFFYNEQGGDYYV